MKLIKNLLLLGGIIFLIWILFSYVEVIMHNSDQLIKGEAYTYPAYNFFIWVTNIAK